MVVVGKFKVEGDYLLSSFRNKKQLKRLWARYPSKYILNLFSTFASRGVGNS